MARVLSVRSLPIAGVMLFALILASCGGDSDASSSTYDEPIIFAHPDFASPVVHANIAQFILEEGYGYETDSVFGTTAPLFQGVQNGDIDVHMEIWAAQNARWDPSVADGSIIDLGQNYEDTPQGWYVPTYMIEGDPERGIEPITPDLQHVDDLPQYADVFQDPEVPELGRMYAGIPGWDLTLVNQAKLQYYGLDEYYNPFLPGSEPALMVSLTSAYEAGEPWLGYLWEPHWITAQLDMTLLEEPPYSEECWETIYDGTSGCQFPSGATHKGANPEFVDEAPEEVIQFLENYETTTDLTAAALLYMQENEIDEPGAALWFLREHEEVWTEWVSDEIAEKVKDALNDAEAQ